MKNTSNKLTLADSLERAIISNRLDGVTEWAYEVDGEPYDEVWAKAEYEAEKWAEGAWLRHAENAGWEEALLESYYESGLRARPR